MISEQGELADFGTSAPAAVVASAPAGKVRRTGYLEKYTFYVERYGKQVRTIKRWAKEGAPLDDALAMERWWAEAHPAQRVPEGILAAVAQERIATRSEVQPAAAEPRQHGEDPHAGASSADRAAAIEEEEMGLAKAFDRLCRLEVLLAEDYAAPGKARDYVSTVSRLTNTGKALRLELQELGELVPKTEAAAAVSAYGQAIGREADGLFEEMCGVLGIPATVEHREKWLAATKEFRSRLEKEVFPS